MPSGSVVSVTSMKLCFLYNARAGVLALPVCTMYVIEDENMLNI
ncbi:Acetyltransferase, GNAT [Bacillus mycoides]|nr:Acetyltransferase, GNAT [Bacillus mycoides]EEL05245.1 acetyltransferase, GNAT [Bacillus cereus BDRD-ST196]